MLLQVYISQFRNVYEANLENYIHDTQLQCSRTVGYKRGQLANLPETSDFQPSDGPGGTGKRKFLVPSLIAFSPRLWGYCCGMLMEWFGGFFTARGADLPRSLRLPRANPAGAYFLADEGQNWKRTNFDSGKHAPLG